MFAIAHFVERNEIEVVPATWISGTLCKWPQGSTDRAKRLILKACPPEDTWVSYKVIVRGIYSTYAEARRKLNDLQYHSDVNSEAEMNTRKRNRLPPKRFCEESSEESDGDKNQNVPPFPPEKSGEKGRHGSLSQRNSAEHVGKSKKRRPPPLLEETDEEDLLLDVPPDFPSQCPSSSNLQYSGEQSQCPPSLPNENPEENNGPGITASQGVFTEHVARSKKKEVTCSTKQRG
ncbi:uncharacterized protein LOC135386901 isoform X2 [Ornithodoros turicata]|uniref:uncharacterized protein LOC135386901 isoform X2 n=1 Tax=Ornithodoros turicata TaxID=34597 RepID=UPI003138C3E4